MKDVGGDRCYCQKVKIAVDLCKRDNIKNALSLDVVLQFFKKYVFSTDQTRNLRLFLFVKCNGLVWIGHQEIRVGRKMVLPIVVII